MSFLVCLNLMFIDSDELYSRLILSPDLVPLDPGYDVDIFNTCTLLFAAQSVAYIT